jgi:glycosyltransferase involved in cell wall biosynthesis
LTILCLADTRFPIERANGAQTIATCRALALRGHDVTLVVRPDQTQPPRDPWTFYGLQPPPSMRIAAIPASRRPQVHRARFLLGGVRLAVQHRHAVVFTRDLGLASLLLRLARTRRPPIVYESHGVAPVVAAEMPQLLGKPELAPAPAKLARLDRRERHVWQRADAYVAITRALRAELAARYGARPAAAVVPDAASPPAGFDDSALHRQRMPEPGARDSARPFLAAYAGHFYPWKGVDVLVRAVASTRDVHLRLVGGHAGEPDLARVQALVDSLGIRDRVTMTGLVPWAEVPDRLRDADVLVLPNPAAAISERYASPLKLFEYLSLGKPIVASDLPAVREIVTANQSALLVPPGDATALASALERLRADPALATSLAEAAARLAPAYTWERRAEQLEVVLAAVAP